MLKMNVVKLVWLSGTTYVFFKGLVVARGFWQPYYMCTIGNGHTATSIYVWPWTAGIMGPSLVYRLVWLARRSILRWVQLGRRQEYTLNRSHMINLELTNQPSKPVFGLRRNLEHPDKPTQALGENINSTQKDPSWPTDSNPDIY